MSAYTGEDLVAAVHQLNRVANYGGIRAKREAVGVLAEVAAEGIAIATRVLAFELRQAGYAPAVTDAVYVAATSFSNAAGQLEHAKAALDALLNTRLGDLPESGQQMPHHTEMNGSH